MPRHLLSAIVLAAAAFTAAPAEAQKLYLSPTIGLYAPLTDLSTFTSGGQFRQEVGLSVGGRVGVGLGKRFALEVTGNYVPSSLRRTLTPGGVETSEDANLYFGSARATFFVLPPTSPLWISLSGGASLIGRSGAAYAALTDKNDIGALAGAAAGVNLGPVSVFVGTDAYLYKTKAFGTANENRGQRDLQVNFGLGVPLAR